MIKTRKDRIKAVRAVLEGIVLLILLLIFLSNFFSFNTYEPFKEEERDPESTGFVALSYFGVDRTGTETLISTADLEEELSVLYDQGFVTITQQDIRDYYETGKPLPEKALFLMFEDGRRDTATFAQKILEKYDYKASMLTYAEKFLVDDAKFLSASDLETLRDSTFWELGTNGYRLFYINVFDRYDNFLGELGSLEYENLTSALGRNYNHFLMDYIRDEYGVPRESYDAMRSRIGADYEGMEREYTDRLGELPGLYALMHSNTGKFGNNDRVSETNAEWIYSLFDMNFNREGFCFNSRDDGHTVYDLTRMQPQSYWGVNHLLMRILYDSHLDVDFVDGDPKEYANWQVTEGALECQPEKLILTSLPEGRGEMVLQDLSFADGEAEVTLSGNRYGTQTLYFRSDEALKNGVFVSLENNVLKVGEVSGGREEPIVSQNLDEFDGIVYDSASEDEKKMRLLELETMERYAVDSEEAREYADQAAEVSDWETVSVEEGSPAYVPELDIHDRGSRTLNVILEGERVKVLIDGREAAEVRVENTGTGSFGFACGWEGFGWSQRNLSDDVYDGVMEKVTIRSLPEEGEEKGEILYDNRYHGLKKIRHELSVAWKRLIDFFIKYL